MRNTYTARISFLHAPSSQELLGARTNEGDAPPREGADSADDLGRTTAAGGLSKQLLARIVMTFDVSRGGYCALVALSLSLSHSVSKVPFCIENQRAETYL